MRIDPRAGQLVTLMQASERTGKTRQYFSIRRKRFRLHPEYPFPEPVMHIAGADVFDLQTLVVWDAQRHKRRDDLHRSWAENREPKETTP